MHSPFKNHLELSHSVQDVLLESKHSKQSK
jgi:hypothetical protein